MVKLQLWSEVFHKYMNGFLYYMLMPPASTVLLQERTENAVFIF